MVDGRLCAIRPGRPRTLGARRDLGSSRRRWPVCDHSLHRSQGHSSRPFGVDERSLHRTHAMKRASTATARSMLCVALFCGGATAQPLNEAGELERLKQHYLTCNRIATLRRLSPTEIMRCSEVAEALLRRGFGGD